MKKDITRSKVEGVYVAIARDAKKPDDHHWFVYLINDNDYTLENVLVTSEGFGKLKGENRKTSILRQFFDKVDPRSFEVVEPIDPEIFVLCQKFWVSYYLGREIYDKKYIFLPEALTEKFIKPIDLIGMDGILHN